LILIRRRESASRQAESCAWVIGHTLSSSHPFFGTVDGGSKRQPVAFTSISSVFLKTPLPKQMLNRHHFVESKAKSPNYPTCRSDDPSPYLHLPKLQRRFLNHSSGGRPQRSLPLLHRTQLKLPLEVGGI